MLAEMTNITNYMVDNRKEQVVVVLQILNQKLQKANFVNVFKAKSGRYFTVILR